MVSLRADNIQRYRAAQPQGAAFPSLFTRPSSTPSVASSGGLPQAAPSVGDVSPPYGGTPARDRQAGGDREGNTLPALDSLERRLGVTFSTPALLHQAMVHSSYVNENPGSAPESNERLEFLGDAVLGLVVAAELYETFPKLDEGKLTELRTQLVRRDTLAKVGRELGLGDDLLLGRGEEAGGGRERPNNLAHAYEAIVGAIFLDGGLVPAHDFVRRSLSGEFELLADRAFPGDPKSQLQELTQSRYQSTPVYRTVEAEGPDHARFFTVEVQVGGQPMGTGRGQSKQMAEKEAAREALERLRTPHEETGTSSECT